MRGWVAISVTATPAAAPRRIREVLRMIIREPSGLRLRPTTGLDRREPRPCGTPHIVRVGLHRPLWQRPIGLRRPLLRRARPLPRTAPSQRISVPSQRARHVSAAGIKDQELTIIVSMMTLSAGFNMWPVLPVKWVLRRFDHSAIYLLIAGTYTPFLAQMNDVLASAGLGSRALACLQLVSGT